MMTLANVLFILAALLAIRVVRELTARLEERFRRIRYSTPESLVAQGLSLGSGLRADRNLSTTSRHRMESGLRDSIGGGERPHFPISTRASR
jgi:hypothetical protein